MSEIHKLNDGQVRPAVVDMGYFAYSESNQLPLALITNFFREPHTLSLSGLDGLTPPPRIVSGIDTEPWPGLSMYPILLDMEMGLRM